MESHDYSGTRYSPPHQITTANVSQLRAVCAYQVGETGNFQTGPSSTAAPCTLTSVSATIALDAAHAGRNGVMCGRRAPEPLTNNRGVAVKDGRVVRATTTATCCRSTLKTAGCCGPAIWRIRPRAKRSRWRLSVYDNLISSVRRSATYAIKGWVGAFRLDDGEPVWRFNIVPAPASLARKPGSSRTAFPSAAAVCGRRQRSIERETIYVATGNPAPDFPADFAAVRISTRIRSWP